MKWYHRRRLEKLANFLKTLKRKQFDFTEIIAKSENGCGTVCCAVGWLPAVDRNIKWAQDLLIDDLLNKKTGEEITFRFGYASDGILNYFGISQDEAKALFIPNQQYLIGENELGEKATPKQVAKLIEKFLKK